MTTNPSSIHFTPRQVVMALESQSVKKEKREKSSKKGSSEVLEGSKEMVLNGGELAARGKGREILLRSIAGFLESNGFKKTLAMFQSEAQIEENSWKSPAVNLNDFVAKFSESSDALAVPAIEKNKPQGIEKETQKKTKKKNANDTSGEQTVDEKTTLSKPDEDERQLGKKEKRKKKSGEESKPVEEEREVDNQEKKDKKKKKYSDPPENGNVNAEKDDTKKEKEEKLKKKKEIEEVKKPKQMKEEVNATYENEQTETSENIAKKKDKEEKKRKKKETQVGKEMQEKEEKEKVIYEETIIENGEKTVSKKRKKGEEDNVENDGKKRKLEANGGAKTFPEENMDGPKSGKREIESAEPKSANAFKRVKIEEVKFADQRLQDNSYWAKDGADSGYGAKAQEILEQVRGRDFRHEKTKKKRGTYRGGQIDLQSHSIKFNYSDDE